MVSNLKFARLYHLSSKRLAEYGSLQLTILLIGLKWQFKSKSWMDHWAARIIRCKGLREWFTCHRNILAEVRISLCKYSYSIIWKGTLELTDLLSEAKEWWTKQEKGSVIHSYLDQNSLKAESGETGVQSLPQLYFEWAASLNHM